MPSGQLTRLKAVLQTSRVNAVLRTDETASPCPVAPVRVGDARDVAGGEAALAAGTGRCYNRTSQRRGGWVCMVTEKDTFNKVSFAPATTDALKVDITLQDRWSVGVQEIVIE